MIVCVTGSGPTLSAAHVPDGAFVIGVNRSFERIVPHVLCVSDDHCLRYLLRKRWKGPVMWSAEFPDSAKWASPAGAFALWYASLFEPTEIHLTGFGGEGHFYNDEQPGCKPGTVEYYSGLNKRALKMVNGLQEQRGQSLVVQH